jgi:prepilin-type N-terminal cleavage/methylation domain-containing protein
MLRKLLGKKEGEGFTLIEVVIVLAIAGLIFVIIFLAVSQAQKNRRDTARKNDANRIGAAIEQFASNSGGAMPTAAQLTSTVLPNYANNPKDPSSDAAYTADADGTCGSGDQGRYVYAPVGRQYTLTMCLETGTGYSVTNQ